MHPSFPQILGILNITEDSFSDGGKFISPNAALEKAQDLISQGAHIIDIGPASSNPASAPVPAEIQIRRAGYVIPFLKEKNIPISIDVSDPAVQSWAVDQNVDYINDIDGFKNTEIIEKLKGRRTKLIVMHSLQRSGKADTRKGDPETIIESIRSFFSSRLDFFIKMGIEPQRLIFDPGMGFFIGSNPSNSIITLNSIKNLKDEFQVPILISVSRKSFLGEITGKPAEQRDFATLSAEIYCIYTQNADMIRTHNPGALSDAVSVWNSLLKSKYE